MSAFNVYSYFITKVISALKRAVNETITAGDIVAEVGKNDVVIHYNLLPNLVFMGPHKTDGWGDVHARLLEKCKKARSIDIWRIEGHGLNDKDIIDDSKLSIQPTRNSV